MDFKRRLRSVMYDRRDTISCQLSVVTVSASCTIFDICLAVLTQYWSVTGNQANRQTAWTDGLIHTTPL